jgi:hypothetical protein
MMTIALHFSLPVAGLQDIADSESDDDSDSNLKKKKVSKAHQASSSGSGAGMLSASFMSGGGGRAASNERNGEKKKLKKRTSRLGDVEWASATWGEERVKAVIKGIDKSVYHHHPLA